MERCLSPPTSSKMLDTRAEKLKKLFEYFFSEESLESAYFANHNFARVRYRSHKQCDLDARIIIAFPEETRVGGGRHLLLRANTLFGKLFSYETQAGPVNPKPRKRPYGNDEFITCLPILLSRFGGNMCLPNVYVACPYVYTNFFGTAPQELWTDENLIAKFDELRKKRDGRKDRDFSAFMKPGHHTIFPVHSGSHWSVVVVLYVNFDAPEGENTVFFGVDHLVCHNMSAIVGNLTKYGWLYYYL